MQRHEHHPSTPTVAAGHSHTTHTMPDGMVMSGAAHSMHSGHHHADMIADFGRRFWVVLVLTLPVMALSPMIQHWLGVAWIFPGSGWLLFGLSTVVYGYGGWPFLKGLWLELSVRNPGMMTLVGIAISVAYLYSVAITFGLTGMDFYWELATLILVMLLGHWIEMKSIAGAGRELELLVALLPSEAHLVHGDQVMEVKTDSLKPNDLILVKPGERIPADGVIADGESYLNESMLTGESTPVQKKTSDKITAGSINGNGALHVTVSHASADNYLSKVINLVRDAQQSKSKTQLLADRAARWLTVIALAAGVLTFVYWYFLAGSGLAFSMERMVTVIVICCPHALGLAVPLVVAKSTALSAKHGLLIKNRTAFENARKITTLVFDKTGTLTVGEFKVVRFEALGTIPKADVLRFAAALEQNSEHPIATGILAAAKEQGLNIPSAGDFQAITGQGVQGTLEGKKGMVVSPGYLREQQRLPELVSDAAETIVFVLIDGTVAGFIALADAIRPESAGAIRSLKNEGIKTMLLTGDNARVAESVSKQLGMDGFFAEVLPDQKLDKIKELQGEGEFVAMTGDGVNDAPALAQADVGIAIGSGSDIAAETAGIVLVNSNPQDVVSLIKFGKATRQKMVQNLIWACGYNLIALPLAAGIAIKWGLLLSPAAGAILMTVSTVVVALNASRLRVR